MGVEAPDFAGEGLLYTFPQAVYLFLFPLCSELFLDCSNTGKKASPPPPPCGGNKGSHRTGTNVLRSYCAFPASPPPAAALASPRAAPQLLAAAGEQFPSIPPPSSQDVHIRTSASAGFHGRSLRSWGEPSLQPLILGGSKGPLTPRLLNNNKIRKRNKTGGRKASRESGRGNREAAETFRLLRHPSSAAVVAL